MLEFLVGSTIVLIYGSTPLRKKIRSELPWGQPLSKLNPKPETRNQKPETRNFKKDNAPRAWGMQPNIPFLCCSMFVTVSWNAKIRP